MMLKDLWNFDRVPFPVTKQVRACTDMIVYSLQFILSIVSYDGHNFFILVIKLRRNVLVLYVTTLGLRNDYSRNHIPGILFKTPATVPSKQRLWYFCNSGRIHLYPPSTLAYQRNDTLLTMWFMPSFNRRLCSHCANNKLWLAWLSAAIGWRTSFSRCVLSSSTSLRLFQVTVTRLVKLVNRPLRARRLTLRVVSQVRLTARWHPRKSCDRWHGSCHSSPMTAFSASDSR